METRVHYEIKGTLQGVGFRPFVHRTAVSLELSGWVRNTPSGVTLEIEGPMQKVADFGRRIFACKPPAARIDNVVTKEISTVGESGFNILASLDGAIPQTHVTPDLALCADCLEELQNLSDRRYGYPFINCTNCGPRFTIIRDLPYDRPNTTMASFIMCPVCREEYGNPKDRRFHAQPNACSSCGPKLTLKDSTGRELASGREAVEQARQLLAGGFIIAIKGLGGYHLACNAFDEKAVHDLRKRKLRYDKPFAVMARDLDKAASICRLGEKETALLTGPEAPIVLAARKGRAGIAPSVAPNNPYLGVMLPYTPLHRLLMEGPVEILVMTSGNISDEPIVCDDGEAIKRLGSIADYILSHDRPIYRRCDDSVTGVFRNMPYPLRRSRGFVPAPLFVGQGLISLLACGAEQKNTFALTRGNAVLISHHIGDLENYETLASFEEGVEYFKKILAVEPEMAVHDLHPDYLSTQYALKSGLPCIAVQHHHAHAASCMADNDLDQTVLAVTFDGTGLGDDGTLWGGEFLLGDYAGYRRVAKLSPVPMPGGAKAISEPWRMAASYLEGALGQGWVNKPLPIASYMDKDKWIKLRQAMEQRVNSPFTSSMGRLFDGVAAIMGICPVVNYEGQAAVELELAAIKYCSSGVPGPEGLPQEEPFTIKQEYSGNELIAIDIPALIRSIAGDILDGEDRDRAAWRFHWTIALLITRVCQEIRRKLGDYPVCLTGGVFQNMLLLEMAVSSLERVGFRVYTHSRVPANDGGIALGQAMIGHARRAEICV